MPDSLTATPIIKVDGTALQQSVMVTGITVRRGVNAAAHTRIRIGDAANAPASLKVGAALEVAVQTSTASGGGAATTVFVGVVVAVGLEWGQARSELIVDAYDRSFRLARTSAPATHIDATFGDIITSIVQSIGLQADIPSDLSGTYKNLARWGTAESIVTELCRSAGCVWFVQDTTFTVKRRSVVGSKVTLSGDTNLRAFTARFSAMDQTSKVEVRGWDSVQKKAIVGEATGVNNGAPSTVASSSSTPLNTDVAHSWSRLVSDVGSAQSLAEGVASRMGSTVVQARGETIINPSITPGCTVTIEHVTPAWNGDYVITSVEHMFGPEQSFVTRFHAGDDEGDSLVGLLGGGRNAPSSQQITSGLTIGIVTNNKDNSPDGKKINRVKLKLPYLSDTIETDWARVVSPGGGSGRGLVAVPEIDDEVLVGFEHGDVRRPYVLGGLWNGIDASPNNTDDTKHYENSKVVTRSFTSRVGHQLLFVDDQSGDGNVVQLSVKGSSPVVLKLSEKDGIELTHAGDLPITIKSSTASIVLAKGGDITLKGKNVKIEAQQNVEIKGLEIAAKGSTGVAIDGGTKFEAKGAMANVEASGITTIKGSMVKVN